MHFPYFRRVSGYCLQLRLLYFSIFRIFRGGEFPRLFSRDAGHARPKNRRMSAFEGAERYKVRAMLTKGFPRRRKKDRKNGETPNSKPVFSTTSSGIRFALPYDRGSVKSQRDITKICGSGFAHRRHKFSGCMVYKILNPRCWYAIRKSPKLNLGDV